jgi:hypothetical protein
MVEQSPCSQDLDISHNQIGEISLALSHSKVLKLHPRMNWIVMSHCNLGLSDSTVTVGCRINLDLLGADKISEYLESNPPVKTLELNDNGFNDDDAILLCCCWALRKNTNLPEINLRSNYFISVLSVKVAVCRPLWLCESACHIRVQSHM